MNIAIYSTEPKDGVCAKIRLLNPLFKLKDKVNFKWAVYRKDYGFSVNLEILKWADIVIIQRLFPSKRMMPVLEVIYSCGRPVIYETDDYFCEKPLVTNPCSTIIKERYKYVLYVLKKSDCITVSSDYLKRLYKKYNKNIKVIPNYIEIDNSYKKNIDISNTVEVGYLGTNTHDADLEIIEEVLIKLKEKYGSKLSFSFFGCATDKLRKLDGFKEISSCNYELFTKKMSEITWDISISPLEINTFNKAKSNIKWLECSKYEIPTVLSKIEPYNNCVDTFQTGILVNNTFDEWYDALEVLIDNVDVRRKIAKQAKMKVFEKYNLDIEAKHYFIEWSDCMKIQKKINLSFNEIFKTCGLNINSDGIAKLLIK